MGKWLVGKLVYLNGGRKMSDKRFECDSQDVQFSIVEDGELILANPTYVVNLLNSLQEENEQLKKELKGLNRKYIAFSEATDKRLKEMMKEMMK